MGAKLIIKQIGGGEIGMVTQLPDGRLVVQAQATDLQAELESVLTAFRQHPLTFTYGATETADNQTVHKTLSKTVKPGDPDYLRALADAMSKSGSLVRGQRVRAYVVSD